MSLDFYFPTILHSPLFMSFLLLLKNWITGLRKSYMIYFAHCFIVVSLYMFLCRTEKQRQERRKMLPRGLGPAGDVLSAEKSGHCYGVTHQDNLSWAWRQKKGSRLSRPVASRGSNYSTNIHSTQQRTRSQPSSCRHNPGNKIQHEASCCENTPTSATSLNHSAGARHSHPGSAGVVADKVPEEDQATAEGPVLGIWRNPKK